MTKKRSPRWKAAIAPPCLAPTHAMDVLAPRVRATALLAEEQTALPQPTAVLVFHGIGEEVRFETLSRAASLILKEAEDRGATGISVEVRSVTKDAGGDGLEVRSELKWTEPRSTMPDGTESGGEAREVHVYEAYWAPLTVGKISYVETLLFLLSAGWNGVRGAFFSGGFGSFQRWLFGGFKRLRATAGTLPLLIVLIALIGFFAGTVAVAAYDAARAAKLAVSGGRAGLMDAANLIFHQVAAPWNKIVHAFGAFLSYFFYFPDGPVFLNHIKFDSALSRSHPMQGIVALALWGVAIYLALTARGLLAQYAGSVAIYLSPYKDSRFQDLRNRIQKVGLDAAQLIYEGHRLPGGWMPRYEKIVILGHSLGSVVAYDTLNAMINLESARRPAGAANSVVDRTAALVTFGSPLDKTAFLFRVQLDVGRNPFDEAGELRETMVSAVQPLIADYGNRYDPARQPHGQKWINLWSRRDIISGRLDYYDDPAVKETDLRHVQNKIDPGAWIPIVAHVQYWTKKLLRQTVYDELF